MSQLINFRATEEDQKILSTLTADLEVPAATVIRLALRELRDIRQARKAQLAAIHPRKQPDALAGVRKRKGL